MQRRSFVKWAAAFPLLAKIGWEQTTGRGWAEVARNSTDNLYTRLGVKPLINARGTWTYLSASLELPQVRAAQVEAAQHFVNIFELQQAAGRRLAQLTGAESGMITSGAAGAMAVATAGCIAGTDPDRVWQLPNTDGLKNEVIMVGGRSVFDSAIRLTGAKLVLVDSAEQIAKAVTPNTVMIYTTSPPEQLAKEIAAAKASRVPIFMDAADGIPPVNKLQLFARMGCDLYTFSGGKGLCGPQSSGILLGRKDLIDAALANSNPWEGAVCRPMKVGKEEIMGCLAAVEAWLKMDVAQLNRDWDAQIKRIATLVETVPGVEAKNYMPEENQCPTLAITWDQKGWRYSTADCAKDLLEGTPGIAVLTEDNPSDVLSRNPAHRRPPRADDKLQIVSMTLRPGEEIIIGQRIRQLLAQARKAAS
jgi:seryl-tRNA(Sec) selenium transferase